MLEFGSKQPKILGYKQDLTRCVTQISLHYMVSSRNFGYRSRSYWFISSLDCTVMHDLLQICTTDRHFNDEKIIWLHVMIICKCERSLFTIEVYLEQNKKYCRTVWHWQSSNRKLS